MRRVKHSLPALLLSLAFVSVSCGPDPDEGPRVTLSLTRVPASGHTYLTGTGFTPLANVTSHLLRPDGGEFPWLPIMTDSEGGFSHDIDSLLLEAGTHEVWVVDDTTGVSSNVATFDVTLEQAPPE